MFISGVEFYYHLPPFGEDVEKVHWNKPVAMLHLIG